MPTYRMMRDRWIFVLRMILLVMGLSAYLISPDDVVWHIVKGMTHARLLEHVLFGIAAGCLGLALCLRISRHAGDRESSRGSLATASLLQAVGIGSLLPGPGFLLLVFGELGLVLLAGTTQPLIDPERSIRGALLAEHLGLLCAFVSMIVFSVVLMDWVADVLFAVSGAAGVWQSARGVRASPAPARIRNR